MIFINNKQIVLITAIIVFVLCVKRKFIQFIRSTPTHVNTRCSFELFIKKHHEDENGFVNGSGQWTWFSSETPLRFVPNICLLSDGPWMNTGRLIQCLRGKKVHYIILMGDSNGWRYFNKMGQFLTNGPETDPKYSIRCRYINLKDPDRLHTKINYNMDVRDNLTEDWRTKMPRHTATGAARKRCNISDGGPRHDAFGHLQCQLAAPKGAPTTLVVQFVRHVNIMNPLVISGHTNVVCSDQGEAKLKMQIKSKTFLEFVLTEFTDEVKPDMIIIFGNSHEHGPLAGLSRTISEFANTIKRHLSNTTKLIWTSMYSEYAPKKPQPWRSMRYEGGRMNRLEYLAAGNEIMYKKMKEYFSDHPAIPLPFPDLLHMSEPVMEKWQTDGVHMNKDWYPHVLSFIFQSFCSEYYV